MNLPNQDIFYLLPMKHFHCFVESMEIKQMNAMKRCNKHQKIPPFYNEWPKDKKNLHIAGPKMETKSSIWVIACNPNSKCKQWARFSTKTHTMLDDQWPMPPKKWSLCFKTNNRWAWMKTRMKAESWNIVQLVFVFLRIIK